MGSEAVLVGLLGGLGLLLAIPVLMKGYRAERERERRLQLRRLLKEIDRHE